ncbi:glycosyltransferase family 4 protein [Paenibacillus lycopersici]|uniref:Glycosyltransferase family 4 protein n=1 Tax=Paenibacillus lycopersici TaxID=2704462 RepID=A0A6C0G360_9BACL|nr:glycosyltransferase family 4 protein [Paenibacillus lycopersici]QHT62171.1 glycosyltransferase family 4 protein [Paenibacillus lycopersici]
MRILFVAPSSREGGLQTTLRNRINALRAHGNHSEVVFLEKSEGEYIFKDIVHYYMRSPAEFQKKIMTGNYDIISFIYSLQFLPYVPKTYQGKVLYEVRGWNREIAGILKSISSTRKVHAVMCIAKYLKPLVMAQLTTNVQVFVEGNAVDPMFQWIAPEERTWNDCPIPVNGRKVIAFAARMERSKNWFEFVRICEQVNQIVSIEPWFICNPTNRGELAEVQLACERSGLTEISRFMYNIPNSYMPEVYSEVKRSGGIILSPSVREGLGNHILEPMAVGVPIVSTDVPGKNEIITHGINGLLYKYGHIDMAVECVVKAMGDEKLRNALIANGLATIQEEYSPSVYVKRYSDLLAQI